MNDSVFWAGLGAALLIGQVETTEWWTKIITECGSLGLVALMVWLNSKRVEDAVIKLIDTDAKLKEEIHNLKSEMRIIHHIEFEEDKE